MKNEIHPALIELIKAPEASRAEEQILALVRGLRDEGVPLRALARGLAGAICALIGEECTKGVPGYLWAKHFLRELEGGFGVWAADFDTKEDLAEASLRNRAAGGSGTSFQ